MSYVLFLGFGVNVYKKFPLIRIFLNDNFIDEFEISGVENCNNPIVGPLSDELVEFKEKKIQSRLNPYVFTNYLHKIKKCFNNKIFLKTFEFDESYINSIEKHKLKIQVINDDNNFTNGFLTKYTSICLSIVEIIPKKILINYLDILDNYESALKKIRSNQVTIKEILSYYKDLGVYNCFDILNYATNNRYNPYIWYNNKNDMFKVKFNELIGISGHTDLFFDKKVYTYKLKKDSLNNTSLYILANKYNQYANQRNTD